MRSVRGLVVVAVLAFLVGLVALFPARVAYHWFGDPAAASLSGISGTVWKGQARELSAAGIYLGDVEWRLKPRYLLTGTALFAVQAKPVSGFLESDVGLGFGGALSFKNLAASLPLAPLAGPLRVPGLQGNASLQFERITVVDRLPVAADGNMAVSDFAARLLYRGTLGGFKAEFFTQNNGVAASVEDTDGVIDLAGSLQIGSDRTYQFLGKIAAKPNTPQALRNQMRVLGNPDARGQYELRLEGVL